MTSEPNLLAVIQRQLSELNKSESKVAHAILNAPEEATRLSIASLATAAGVSEPSVNRFCKRFGATGFPDFKLQLATSLASGVRYVSRAVEFSDDINTFPVKLFNNAITALMTCKGRSTAQGDCAGSRPNRTGTTCVFFWLGNFCRRSQRCRA
jgi:RpiR family carbohydrate utilization transcriptional regulator